MFFWNTVYIGVSLTAFYRLGQKVSDRIPILRITAIAPQPILPFLFVLSVVKCGRIHMRTLRHRAIQVGQAVSTRRIKNFDKFTSFFRSFLAFTSPISQQPLKLEPYKQRTYLFSHPCTPCRNPMKPVPVKNLCRMRMAGLYQFY